MPTTNQHIETAAAETAAHGTPNRLSIQDVSAWVLRVGVVTSVSVMLIGMVFSFLHGTTSVDRMEHDAFEYRPQAIMAHARNESGKAIIEVGIYLLVLTPILRVATSMILFLFEEHDWLYTIVTFFVLILTLAGLLFLK